MEIKGRIIQILPLQSGVSANGEWKKQEYILETDAQFPRKVCFSVFGGANKEDKIASFDIKEGEELVVSIDLDSREYNGRWYTNVSAWKVDRVQPGQTAPAPAAPFPTSEQFSAQPSSSGISSTDDLPF